MTVEVKLLSALIRKVDIAEHYPGGCAAFEANHLLGEGDSHLYRLIAMSGQDLEWSIEQIAQAGLETDRFVSIADMWGGPCKHEPGIEYVCEPDTFPPRWFAHASEESSHDRSSNGQADPGQFPPISSA